MKNPAWIVWIFLGLAVCLLPACQDSPGGGGWAWGNISDDGGGDGGGGDDNGGDGGDGDGGGGGSGDQLQFEVKVSSDSSVELVSPNLFDSQVTYPGVTATRENERIEVEVAANNSEATSLTLTVKNTSNTVFPRLWLILRSLDANAELATIPDAENGNIVNFENGEPIFVFGPLQPDAEYPVVLDFTLTDPSKGYGFTFDVLAIADRLTFTSKNGALPTMEVFTANPDGSDMFQVTSTGRNNIEAVLSPGGERIAFASLSNYYDIYTVHPDGSHLTPVTQGPDSSLHPSWSPDGKRLVYDCLKRSTDSVQDICVANATGGNESVLISGYQSALALPLKGQCCTADPFKNCLATDPKAPCKDLGIGWYQNKIFLPSWSPDGTKIISLARHPEKYSRFYFLLQKMDPIAYAPIGNLVILNRPWDQTFSTNSNYWMTLTSTLSWGPDSQHASFEAYHYAVTTPPGLCFYPSCGTLIPADRRYISDYYGPWILDLASLQSDPLYGNTIGPYLDDHALPVITGSLDPLNNQGRYLFSSLSGDGARIAFDQSEAGGVRNIVALPLVGYQPAGSTLQTLVANGGDNFAPVWTKRLLPDFYR